MERLYFEEVEIGFVRKAGPYIVSKEDIIAFAKKFDPAPRHTDEEAAAKSVFKGLTASSAHTFAMVIYLAGRTQPALHNLAGLGWDELRLPAPVRPGDELHLDARAIEKRESKSQQDRGIVRSEISLRNQNGDIVFRSISTVLVACRPTRP